MVVFDPYALEVYMKVKISDILIKDRIRQSSGDLAPLMESMMNHGLLNPITINHDYELLAGFRRLEAGKNLGWTDIECHMVSAKSDLEKLLIETEENTTRLEFTEDELDKIAELRTYYSATGLIKFILWFRKVWSSFIAFISELIGKLTSK